jgi:hypothetical protein
MIPCCYKIIVNDRYRSKIYQDTIPTTEHLQYSLDVHSYAETQCFDCGLPILSN